jgi:UDP-N-acetylmuramate dehydrogenase
MNFLSDQSLKDYNTFGIDVYTSKFISVTGLSQLNELIAHPLFVNSSRLILGGGSNILFTGDFEGLVLQINLKGKKIIGGEGDYVLVKGMAGENWEEFVDYCVTNDLGGIENLTLIPGNVGTSPMQNIGAYGVEIKDCFHSLEAIEINSGEIKIFNHQECAFGYRDSFFKQEGKGKFIIVSVTFRLTRKNHLLRMDYGSVKEQLKNQGVEKPGIREVKEAIMHIRESKIPDPKKLGNAGSFFKNPVVSHEQFLRLKEAHPEMPSYTNEHDVKIPAGWLIEKAGWKGFRRNDAGVHKNQALVLVNYGSATGKEILDLAAEIADSVEHKFGITLEKEVNII